MDLLFQDNGDWTADCALVFLPEGGALEEACAPLRRLCPWLGLSPALRDCSGKKEELLLLHGPAEHPLSRVLAVGLGKAGDLSLSDFRSALARAATFCRARGFGALALPVETLPAAILRLSLETLIEESVCAVNCALYRLRTYRSEPLEDACADLKSLALCFSGSAPASARLAALEGDIQAEGVLLARNLANEPANVLTPAALAEEAARLAATHGFSCKVLGPEEIRALGMQAFLAVAKGSAQAPRLIILEHCPGGREAEQPLIFVGKGITFDSGGISLKPAEGMQRMKSDMAGAAAVLGLFRIMGLCPEAGALPRVIGIIPATENMPGASATRPGDIVTALSGKTVEIVNTDAEGRLILCDALADALRNWRPLLLADIATLTGACVVALGREAGGLFTDDPALREIFLESAAAVGDLLWPLPLWKEYEAGLKSDAADMINAGAREGGAIQAALFLRKHIGEGVPWVHLDIAGSGHVLKAVPLCPVPGGSGVGARLFYAVLRRFAAQAP
ncbi:MAG: leucyl aminopeptidase [Deltaproteobacteria bacterium]|jgi:leucyl aminopeptidase|nr:leucyl aminopeptidase [Deltaproteobacteria bacterium]